MSQVHGEALKKHFTLIDRCPPEPDLGIVAELQASGGPASEHDRHSLITRAWTKIPLFDNMGRIIAGRFKIPMRNVPIKPFLHVSQVQKLPKVSYLLWSLFIKKLATVTDFNSQSMYFGLSYLTPTSISFCKS